MAAHVASVAVLTDVPSPASRVIPLVSKHDAVTVRIKLPHGAHPAPVASSNPSVPASGAPGADTTLGFDAVYQHPYDLVSDGVASCCYGLPSRDLRPNHRVTIVAGCFGPRSPGPRTAPLRRWRELHVCIVVQHTRWWLAGLGDHGGLCARNRDALHRHAAVRPAAQYRAAVIGAAL